jgi:hypothetical protein
MMEVVYLEIWCSSGRCTFQINISSLTNGQEEVSLAKPTAGKALLKNEEITECTKRSGMPSDWECFESQRWYNSTIRSCK